MIKVLNCNSRNYKKKLINFLEIRRSRKSIDTSKVIKILNDINHNAHDAMGDVEATIKIAQLIKNKAQDVWQSGLINSNKLEVDNFLLKNDILCMDEYFFGKFNSFKLIMFQFCYR